MKNNVANHNVRGIFWNRMAELEALRAWQRRAPRLAVIHGRRRLGKTALLRVWLRDAGGCYVQATEGTPTAQRAAFADDIQAVVPGFGQVTYPSWRVLFDTLKRQWPARGGPLVIDELPYLAQTAPELPSVLQAIVDADDSRRLPFVISGSSQRMMQGLVLNASAPLYGRAQLSLRILPLPPSETRRALGLGSHISAVECYAAFGGVPRYWELMREGGFARAEDALQELVLSPRGILHEEPERVLRDEEAAALERAACELIGRGAHRPSEIAGRLGVKETTLSRTLSHLVELALVERQAAYDFSRGASAEGGKRAVYRLADPFLAMWYSCVRPYLSGLNLNAVSAVSHARQAWKHHLESVWESLCRRQWHQMRYMGIEWEPAGRYWVSREPTGGEWDVVSISLDRKHVFLGEAKWIRGMTKGKVMSIIQEIKRRPMPELKGPVNVHAGLFIPDRQELGSGIEEVALFDAADVMEPPER